MGIIIRVQWAQLNQALLPEYGRKPNWGWTFASQSGGGQFDHRGHSTVVIYSGSDKDLSSGMPGRDGRDGRRREEGDEVTEQQDRVGHQQ